MSTVIRYFIGFALLRSVIGPESSLHYLNQSEQKLKPVTTWSRTFSRALSSQGFLHVRGFFFKLEERGPFS